MKKPARFSLGVGGAHQSVAAAAHLKGNAEELQRLVRQFKL